MQMLRRTGRACGAALALLVLLVGVPAALVAAVGSPLPSRLPDFDQLRTGLNGATIGDDVLINVLACACWVIWILVVWSAAAESRAWLQGRSAGPVPFGGFVQPIVRELIVSATLLFGTLRPSAAAQISYVTDRSTLAVVTPPAPAVELAARADQAVVSEPVGGTCTVKPRDNLWRLAEEHLGDGMRWREIWMLNKGLEQIDGRHFNDSNLIRPGWVLRMPGDALGVDAPLGAPTSDPLLPPPPAADSVQLPMSVPSSVPTEVPSPTIAAPSAPNANAHPNHADDPDYELVPLLAGAALVAAGIVKKLNKLRQRQVRNLEHGNSIPLPSAEVRSAEVSLRHAADDGEYDRLDVAMRNLAACIRAGGAAVDPHIETVTVGPNGVQIRLRDSIDAPSGPFEVADEGRAWTLPASADDPSLSSIAENTTAPCPALVNIGTVDGQSVLIDLEAAPRTLVGGDPDDASALLRTMLLDLSTSTRADDVELIFVGELPAGIDVLDRVRSVVEVNDVIDEIVRRGDAVAASLALSGHVSLTAARLVEDGDCWAPIVVFLDRRCAKGDLDRVLAAATRRTGIAVVAAGDMDGDFDRELCVEGDTLLVKPVGLRVAPASLSADVITATGEMLATAVDLDSFESSVVAGPLATANGHMAPIDISIDEDGTPHLPDGHVLVRVLGPVDIVGGERTVDRRRCVEFVAYLALHREGVDEGRLRSALWPESAPTRTAFNETVSRARRCLGLDADGVPHIRFVDKGIYRVGPHVHIDCELIAAGVAGADGLQRGLPFQGTRGFEWAYDEGLAYSLQRVVDVRDSTDRLTSVSGQTASR